MELITDYSQPEFYRFSRDSIELADSVVKYLLAKTINPETIADLCCGCGVISLEIIQKLSNKVSLNTTSLDLYELQEEYLEHIENNIDQLRKYLPSIKFKTQICNILDDSNLATNSYDLIVMNPPYFNHASGRSALNERTRKCREYKDGQFEALLKKGAELLAPKGYFFFVCREDKDTKNVISNISKNYSIERLDQTNAFSIFLLFRS
ncbi:MULTISPECIES: methyltransferase [unclassified Halobacteriovorax]|uniref:methyltransferase n=1 Tax=unclassified Halobacteriovorax TaxID=2639665 RepID=UPI00399C3FC6